VKADYPSVRNFINRTLSAVPAAGWTVLRIELQGGRRRDGERRHLLRRVRARPTLKTP
jgi:hypothetical protein